MQNKFKRIANDDNKLMEYKRTHNINKPIYEVYTQNGTTVFTSDSYATATNYIDNNGKEENPLFLYNSITDENETV